MGPKRMPGEEASLYGRSWRFGNCEFDEIGRELRISGEPVDLESKPLDVLLYLLTHAGEVVTKDELMEVVWPGVSVVEGSLATAVSKLRKALVDNLAEDASSIVVTIPRVGYRLGVPVQRREVAAVTFPELGFKTGDPVAGRDQWRLTRRLDASPRSEVWLAEHAKTREQRVFKFAADGLRLRGLKREVTLARLLRETLGDRPEFVRLLEWNFDAVPYYLESEYCGCNLVEWAEQHGGLDRVPLAARIELLIEIGQAVAAAHEVGVLHKDLKPTNVLINPGVNGGKDQIKVADFGCGTLLEPSRLGEMGITNLGFTETMTTESKSVTGTVMYMAPEVLAGHAPTVLSDVYALGVMLYQLAVCDFRRPLSPGWEAEVDDPLIREDIAEAASGDPNKRLPSAAALVKRLQTLQERRIQRSDLERAQERARVAERRLAATRVRQPWVIAAVVTLLVGLAVSLALYHKAAMERDRANHETAIAGAMNQFLATDLLGRTDPFHASNAEESLIDAVKRAAQRIDPEFYRAPEIGARLHQSIARALDNRTEYATARQEYNRAAALFVQADGPLSQESVIVNLQRAAMEARTYQQGALPAARELLSQEESRLRSIARPREDLLVWLASARGMIALIDNQAKIAAQQFQIAMERAQVLPDFDETARLTFKQRLAFSYIRLGQGATAERLFRELMAAFTATEGPDSPNVLRVRLNLAQAFMIQGKNAEAVRETTELYPAYRERLGDSHELTLQLLTTRAQCEGAMGLWNDSIRDDQAVYDIAVRKQGASSFFAVATLSDVALAQCRAGREPEGVPNARKAYQAAAHAFGPRAGLTGGAAHTLADCLVATGKLDEAEALLGNIDTAAVAQLTGFPDWSANVDLTRAKVAYRRGDFESARKYLEAARPAFSRPGAEAFQKKVLDDLSAEIEQHQSGIASRLGK